MKYSWIMQKHKNFTPAYNHERKTRILNIWFREKMVRGEGIEPPTHSV
jgi:hypothetical protein